MNWLEYDKCIKYLNPKANYTIDGDLVVTWDFYHVGVKPSWKECLEVLPIVQAEMKAKEDDEYARKKLEELDYKSMRSIREWIASKEDCPQYIADYEAIAVQERTKLK